MRVRSSVSRRCGFSLIDLLVSIAVMAILLGLLSPSLGRVAESAKRVKCQKKLADVGLALTMWADDHRGTLPHSDIAPAVFSAESASRGLFQPSAQMQVARVDSSDPGSFDGLGRLLANDYLSDPSALYCPSHRGEHHIERYREEWVMLNGEIVVNYHFRLFESNVILSRLAPTTTLVTDGMRDIADYNHRTGNNFLKADMSVGWFSDSERYLVEEVIPASEHAPAAGIPLVAAWAVMDTGRTPRTPFGPDPRDTPVAASIDSIVGR